MTVNRYTQLPPPPITSMAVTQAGAFLTPWTVWLNAIWNTLNALTMGPQGVSPGPADFCLWVEGAATNGEVLLGFVIDRTITFPVALAGSRAYTLTPATASAVFSVYHNAAVVGTCTFAIGASTGTFAMTTAQTFVAGDRLYIAGPSPADVTLANVSITLAGTRVN